VLTGSWSAVSAFPLRTAVSLSAQLSTGPGTLEQRAHKVTPENPVPRRIHYEAPVMPDGADVTGATVAMKVTLDDVGRIAEARPTEIVVKAPNFEVNVAGDNFRGQLERDLAGRPAETAAVARQAVEAFVQAAITSVRAWRYDPPAEAPLTFGITIRFGDAPEKMIFSPKESTTALHVGGVIKPPVKIQDARPVYPQEARAAGVTGVVILEVRIGVDGGIEDARVLKSIPQLDQAALDAVRQWKFLPTLMNGQPTAVIMTVTINFDMQ
jgi:protein TonB